MIVIIGGGASGMTAAIAAARQQPGEKIRILEQKDLPGKKILSTGNGRCNFTNSCMKEECFFSDTPSFAGKVIEKFGTEDTLRFFRDLGVVPKERNGYYYPNSDQASAVLSVFRLKMKQLGIVCETGVRVRGIKRGKTGFRIFTDRDTIHADKVILACGGKAAPVLGSDGSGYDIARSLGHTIVPVVPALVQLKIKNHCLAKASGVRADARVSFFQDGVLCGTDKGELQITSYGISGIPVFQISRHAAKAVYYGRHAKVQIDFLPFLQEEEVAGFFRARREGKELLRIADFLVGIFNSKLIPCLLKKAAIREDTKVSEISEASWKRLFQTCKCLCLEVEGTNGFEHAQVCAGGVSLEEVDSCTMESACCRGLYLAGELLDVDGICGGYNLQWAWATGYLAGIHAAGAKQ